MDPTSCVREIPYERPTLIIKINFYLSIILLIFGVVGNGLAIAALKFPLKEKNTYLNTGYYNYRGCAPINIYILKCFFTTSLLSILTLLPKPILRTYGKTSPNPFWVSKAWIQYIAHWHYPISKSLIYSCFLIYIIYFLNQFIAIRYPYYYKFWVTLERVRIAIFLAVTYVLVWYIPVTRWLIVEPIKLCTDSSNVTSPNSTLSEKIVGYQIRMWFPGSDYWKLWTLYELSRELLISIIPYSVMLILKVFVVQHCKLKLIWSNTSPSTDTRRVHSSTTLSFKPTPIVEDQVSSQLANDDFQSKGNGVRNCTTVPTNRSLKRREESRQHLRTMIVLTFEFLFLMIPLSMMEMIMDLNVNVRENKGVPHVYMLLNIFQYIYVGCSFYFNLAFNTSYRKSLIKSLKAIRNYRISAD